MPQPQETASTGFATKSELSDIEWIERPTQKICRIDFESRSECDLTERGSAVYAAHSTTELLCMAWRLGGETRLWTPADGPCPPELVAHIAAGGLLEAHNQAFEWDMWDFHCVPKLGWPPIPVEQWRDSMALCAAFAIPQALGKAAAALGLPEQKDDDGRKVMLRLSQPRRPSKHNPAKWHDDLASYAKLYAYCRRDVEAEAALSEKLPPLSTAELEVWHISQRINRRGIACDLDAVRGALRMMALAEADYHAEVAKLTGGVLSGDDLGSWQRMIPWCAGRGVRLENWQKGTLLQRVEDPELPEDVRRILEIRLALGRASTAKYQAMLDRCSADGRIRNSLQYHGAATGRWCVIGSTPVLIRRNGRAQWRPIKNVKSTDEVWDGGNWVQHSGLMCYGLKPVIRFCGLTATPDHVVYLNDIDSCQLSVAKKYNRRIWRGACLPADFPGWKAVRGHHHPNSSQAHSSSCKSSMQRAAAPNRAGFSQTPPRYVFCARAPFVRLSCGGDALGGTRDRGAKNPGAARLQRDTRRRMGCTRWWTEVAGYDESRPRITGSILRSVTRGDFGVSEIQGRVSTISQALASLARTASGPRTRHFDRQFPESLSAYRRTSGNWVAASGAGIYPGASSQTVESLHCRVGGSARSSTSGVYPQYEEHQTDLGRADGPGTKACRRQNFSRFRGASWPHVSSRGAGSTRPISRGQETYRPRTSQKATARSAPCILDPRAPRCQGRLVPRTGCSKASVYDLCDAGPRHRFLTLFGLISNSGRGIQPQNFPRGKLKPKEVDACLVDMQHLPLGDFRLFWGDPFAAASSCLRGCLTAAPGNELIAADYSAIEARVLLWLAGDPGLSAFTDGRDIYREMAAAIYGIPVAEVTADQRQLGKVTILGCGYGMGAKRFLEACASYGITIDENLAQHVVDTYRTKYAAVKRLWYACEDAQLRAIRSHTVTSVRDGLLRYKMNGPHLKCRLPSGRLLTYPFATVERRMTPWGAEKDAMTYMGVDTMTHQWTRQVSFGGMAVEQADQATSRDIMATAMLRAEARGYPVVGSVHDEIVSEIDAADPITAEHYAAMLAELPPWATGLPITAAGYRSFRYRKG